MLNSKVQTAFNQQIREEMASAYLYLAMSAYFHSQNLDGMAGWMRVQSGEEMEHAMKFFKHLIDRGGRVELAGLDQPKKDWASPLQAFEEAYQHEQYITAKINDLYKIATEEGDHPGLVLLQWFVTEQVEEEASVSKVVELLKMVGNSGSGLVMLDHQLGKREG